MIFNAGHVHSRGMLGMSRSVLIVFVYFSVIILRAFSVKVEYSFGGNYFLFCSFGHDNAHSIDICMHMRSTI